ncbi:MAG TPA: DarT ssDNA thymidine ADP-ribosyltransferase family protein [Exilispira sp.]|nr:DarT ssDNA thymidine ADP-ribosyltransferase family protein [Exilispira sp.]
MDNTPKLKDQINKYLEILDKYDIKYLYHFTDISNLESIKKYGILSREFLDNHNIKYKPGSSDISASLDIKKGKLNYVKLSFNDGHPMIYHAKKYRNINPIFLKIKRDVILFADTLFSNMNSTDNNCISGDDFSTFSLIKFDIVIKPNGEIHPWKNEIEKKYYQAEVMVKERIDPQFIIFP